MLEFTSSKVYSFQSCRSISESSLDIESSSFWRISSIREESISYLDLSVVNSFLDNKVSNWVSYSFRVSSPMYVIEAFSDSNVSIFPFMICICSCLESNLVLYSCRSLYSTLTFSKTELTCLIRVLVFFWRTISFLTLNSGSLVLKGKLIRLGLFRVLKYSDDI
jgi:hypothetical protein